MSVNSFKSLAGQSSKTWRHKVISVVVLSLWVTTVFVAAQFLAFGLLWLFKTLGVPLGFISNNLLTVVFGALVYILMFALLVGVPWLVLRQRPTLKLLGIQRLVSWLDIGISLSGMVVFFIVIAVVTSLIAIYLPSVDLEQQQVTGIVSPQGIEVMLGFVMLVVVAPFVEELIFRGYLYSKLRSSGLSFIWTTLIVSLLFAVAHLQINIGITVFVLSLAMCVGREVSGTIWPGVLMHMMKNGLAFYLLFVNPIIPGL